MTTATGPTPAVGLELMPEPAFAAATAPLFAAGLVDCVEWSFDTIWRETQRPAALRALLDEYATRGRLHGHGVTFGLLSTSGEPRQQHWLDALRRESAARRYLRISEHFGFMTAEGWSDGAPFPPPPTPDAIALGRDRLARIADACGLPVGLENLAFAFGAVDVAGEGDLLEQILAPVDGFLLLDLHNLWCRAVNFGIAPGELLRSYPLHRVRTLHVSGGSWSELGGRRLRRDTHDGGVPDEVFRLVPLALASCERLDTVILEQLGSALAGEPATLRFRSDYLRLRALCHEPVRS